jgi:hypothetical protein
MLISGLVETHDNNFVLSKICYMVWIGACSSTRRGVCVLMVTLPLLGLTNWPTLLSLHIEYLMRPGQYRKHRTQKFFYCCVYIRCSMNVFTKPLSSNGCFFWVHYSCFQASYYTAFKCELEGCTTPRGAGQTNKALRSRDPEGQQQFTLSTALKRC